MVNQPDRRPIVAGNWKMNTGPSDGAALAQQVIAHDLPENMDVVLCPPAVGLTSVAEAVRQSPVLLGAQHIHWELDGAFTGEISVSMVQEFASYVIVGHSERRRSFGETNENVQRKVETIHSAGLIPIIAVGESLEQRDDDRAHVVIRTQVESAIEMLTPDQTAESVIAYEPVWAIGTGRTASPEQAQEAVGWIRDTVGIVHGQDAATRVRIQYGGSVTPDNCADLFGRDGIDGALVGGASLDAGQFAAIVRAA